MPDGLEKRRAFLEEARAAGRRHAAERKPPARPRRIRVVLALAIALAAVVLVLLALT